MSTAVAGATAPTLPAADELSNEQRAVVEHRRGALLVFAGPGSGKTRTLTARIAALLNDGVRPQEILALTFTVRATEEMRVRLIRFVGQHAAHGLTVSTFHGLCARMLRNHANRFGRTSQYSIYDATDLRRLVSDVLADHENQRDPAGLPQGFEADVVTQIAKAKSALWTAQDLRAQLAHRERDLIADLWQLVEQEMQACNAFDFQDLLTHTVQVLTECHEVRDSYRSRWRHILVDEFQDTDPAQFELLVRLAGPSGCGPHGSLMVVGDDDQSAYSFRGAAVSNLLEFNRSFPCAGKLMLRRNYRCSRRVLAIATQCIRHNEQREPKALVARAGAPQGTVSLRRFSNEHAEAAAIAHEIAGHRQRGVDPREITVLCRTLRHTHPLQQALTARGIAHRVIGGHSLWERVEIQDALAHLALICNPYDEVAFGRAVGAPTDREQFRAAHVKAPTRGVGNVTKRQICKYAQAAGIDILRACCAADTLDIRKTARKPLRDFGAALWEIRQELIAGRSVEHLVTRALMFDGGPVSVYQHLLQSTDHAGVLKDTQRVLEDLRSLVRAAKTYDTEHGSEAGLVGFLEEARVEPAHVIHAGEDDRMTVSTIHGAKGTEAQIVYLLGCEERLLPSGYAIDEQDPLRIEEERRLMYIALTRAKTHATVTVADQRTGDQRPRRPSRFLAEAGLL